MPAYDDAMSILGSATASTGDPTSRNLAVSQPDVEAAKARTDDFDSRMSILQQGSAGKLPDGPAPTSSKNDAAIDQDVSNYAGSVLGPDKTAAQSAIYHQKGREAGEQLSAAQTAGLGLQKGTSANFSADTTGLAAASGLPVGTPPVISAPVGAARIGLEKLGAGSEGATQDYANNRDYMRGVYEGMSDAHPAASIGGQIAGSFGLPIGAAAKGATLGQAVIRGAGTGSLVGALYGAGEGTDLQDRASRAATGAVVGGVAGAAAPAVITAVGSVPGAVASGVDKVLTPVRGFTNPEGEAARRVSGAFSRDASAPGSQMMSDADIAAARESGQPVSVLDTGGETTRALARSAANTSPDARAALNNSVNSSLQGQATRTSDFIRDMVGTTGSIPATRENLQAAAAAANRPAYQKAFSDPAGANLWDDTLQTLSSAPAVQSAIKDATQTGANKAAAAGFRPPSNPFQFDDAGNMALRANGDGSTATPTLQFWDTVKRNLDDQVSSLQRSGNKSAAADVIDLRRQLVDHLDSAVPSYQQARGTAASFFGASDALDAGEKFATNRADNDALKPVIARMNPAEKKLFAEGFASSLANKVESFPDRQTVVSRIFQSPQARERVEMALGPDNANRLETYMRVEGLLDVSRRAIQGNSTTARQAIEMGLAGGVGAGVNSYLAGDYSPRTLLTGAFLGSLAKGQINRGFAAVDQNVARRVGEMLASPDVERFRTGINVVSKNPGLLSALRNASLKLAPPAAAASSASQ